MKSLPFHHTATGEQIIDLPSEFAFPSSKWKAQFKIKPNSLK